MDITNWAKPYHSNLLDKDDNILWNGINYTQKSWLEFRNNGEKVYLEKDDGTNMLAVNNSINDLVDEYGENHFPEEAIKDGKLLQFDDYNSLENYVFDNYNFKTKEELYEIGKKEYLKEFVQLITDGKIDDVERTKLSELAAEIGLSTEEITDIEDDFMFTEEDRLSRGIKGFELNTDNAKELQNYWNKNLIHIQDLCCVHGHPVPVLPVMTEEMAKAICDIIDISDHTIYADFDGYDDAKFWIDARNDEYYAEKDIIGIIGFADTIINEWNRDETTITENRYFDIIKSITESKEYLIPVDVNFKFDIPESIWKEYKKNKELVDLYDKVTDSLEQKSELIDNKFNFSYGDNGSKNFHVDWTIRCNIAVKNLNYSTLDYNNLVDVLQNHFGTVINYELGTLEDWKKRVVFNDFSASIPKEFHTERDRLVTVDKTNYQNYLKTPEEYAKGLDLKMLIYAGDTIKDAVSRFQNNQRDFNEILEKNPLLKQYAEENWSFNKSLEKSKTLLCLENNEIYPEEKSTLQSLIDKFYIENIKPIEIFAYENPEKSLKNKNFPFYIDKTISFELDKMLYERHDSLNEAHKDRKEYPVIKWNYIDKDGNEKTQYKTFEIEREKDNLKIKAFKDISYINEQTLSDSAINVAIKVTGVENFDSLDSLIKNGFSIRNSNNKNLTDSLIYPEKTINNYFQELKENCKDNNDEKQILLNAHKILKSYSTIEKEIINNYLMNKDVKTEKSLTKLLKKEINNEKTIKNISEEYERGR